MKIATLRKTLDGVEEKFKRCWQILASLRSPPFGELRDFQPILGDALFDIAEAYQSVREYRRSLIKRKESFSPLWFERRQQLCGKIETALVEARGIGLAMGDAFAWVFFRRDEDLLKEHARHPSTDNLQAGVGGLGELKFVKAAPLIGNYLVLHHALTTILRIGDVSLVDLEDHRVKGVGELKTAITGEDEIEVTMYALANKEFPKPSGPTQKLDMPQKQVQQLRKQYERMSKLLATSKRNKYIPGANLETESFENEFNDLVSAASTTKATATAINDSLVGIAIRLRRRSLYATTFQRGNLNVISRLPDFTDSVNKILSPGSQFNSLIVTPFFYDASGRPWPFVGMIPLFWWRLNLETIRRLIFRETIVVTAFNPAPLMEQLSAAGFEVEQNKHHRQFSVRKMINGHYHVIGGIESMFDLIRQSFFSATEIVEILNSATKSIAEQGIKSGRVGINLKQMLA